MSPFPETGRLYAPKSARNIEFLFSITCGNHYRVNELPNFSSNFLRRFACRGARLSGIIEVGGDKTLNQNTALSRQYRVHRNHTPKPETRTDDPSPAPVHSRPFLCARVRHLTPDSLSHKNTPSHIAMGCSSVTARCRRPRRHVSPRLPVPPERPCVACLSS